MSLREFERLVDSDEGHGELEAEIGHESRHHFLLMRTFGVLTLGGLVLILPIEMSTAARLTLTAVLWLVIAPAGPLLEHRLPPAHTDLAHTVLDISVACASAQGFLFAEPMPLAEFVAFLDGWGPGTAIRPPVSRPGQPVADLDDLSASTTGL